MSAAALSTRGVANSPASGGGFDRPQVAIIIGLEWRLPPARAAKGFVYLVAVMDWFSRRVLSWRVSITMDSDFCVAALTEAMEVHGRPEIFNTDQGVQFTSADFLAGLEAKAVRISMDGKGRYLDNIFIERLWRSLKYEEIFLKAYGSPAEARNGIGTWLTFYNDERPHQTHGYRTPREVFMDLAA